MTLIHGTGVHCPSPRTVTYSRPSSTKPPSPLKNSGSRCGPATSAAGSGLAGRGGVARRLEARELLRERAVSTQEDDPRGHLEGGMILRGEQILPEDEDI